MFLGILILSQHLCAQSRGLEFYLGIGRSKSPLLLDLKNQAALAGLDSERVRAGYQPQISAASYNSYAPVIRGFGYDEAITNGANISSVVSINKSFASQKNLTAQYTVSSLQKRTAENTSKISERDLTRNITAQYITAYGALQQLNFTNEIYQLLRKEDPVLKKLTQDNVYHQTDYLTFLVTLQQQDLAVRQQEIQFQNELATLNFLCGIDDTARVALEAPAIVAAPPAAPEYSIHLLQYALDSLRLQNERRLLDFNYKPRLSLFADAGYNSSFAFLPYRNFGTSFGFGVSLPIYDGHQRRILQQRITIQEQTRSSYRSFFTSQYHQQLTQLSRQLSATQELLAQIDTQIGFARRLIDVNARLLTTGDVRIADLVISLNNYLTARNLLTQNTINRLQIINQINYWSQ